MLRLQMSTVVNKLSKLEYYFNLVNPLIDKKVRVCRTYGPKVEEHYNFFEQSQWWSADELKAYQAEKLRRLIRYVYENVPYYGDLMRRHYLSPKDIKYVEDLRKLPILNKDVIRKNSNKILSNDFSDQRASLARTGASTGEPLVFYLDKKATDIAWGAFFRFFGWIGYQWGDKIALFWRTPDGFKYRGTWYQNMADWLRYSRAMNVEVFDAFRMSDDDLAGYAKRLQHCQPGIIRGYPGSIIYLTNYCIKNAIKGIRPKAITTTAEPLFKRERKLLEDYYSCEVFDHYGCGEVYSIAYECEKHTGLHITTEHSIVEIVDDTGTPVEAGKEGKIILTDLDNYMMPFIRYENGDMGSLKKESCTCGRNLPLMDHVRGRIFGLIRGVNGNVVHGEFFADLLQNLGWYEAYGLMHFEVVQKTIEGFDCNFVCSILPDKKAIEDFKDSCRQYFGNMKINAEFVDYIPTTPAGKRRNTRSEIDPIRNKGL